MNFIIDTLGSGAAPEKAGLAVNSPVGAAGRIG